MKYISGSIILSLLLMNSLAFSQELFFEDFDAYQFEDELLATGWEFISAEGAPDNPDSEITVEFSFDYNRNMNPPGLHGHPTTGQYLISDADKYSGEGDNLLIDSGQSHDAITPSIDCSNASSVWLSADMSVVLNNNGSAIFFIDVKAGDGDWVTMEKRVAPLRFVGQTFSQDREVTENSNPAIPGKDGNMGDLYGRYYLDISEVAAGQSDVRIRFRHFEQDWDWWVAFDNLRISTDPPPQGSEVILGPETFEDGIPADWSRNPDDSGINFWSHGSENVIDVDIIEFFNGEGPQHDGNTLNRLAGQGYAIYQSLEFAPEDIVCTLDTPSLDCSQYSEVFFYAWMEYLPNDGFNGKVQVSTDGGNSFSDVFSYVTDPQALDETGEGSHAMEYYIPIPEAAGQSDVIVRFEGSGIGGGNSSFFAIDDVTITGNTGGTNVPTWMIY